MEDFPVTILKRFDEIYQKLVHETHAVLIPEREQIVRTVGRTSFKLFEDTTTYLASARANEYPHCVSSAFGDRTFRVYYNSYSNKVYVDLNRDRISAIRQSVEAETQVFCEVIRSILFIDRPASEAHPTLIAEAETV